MGNELFENLVSKLTNECGCVLKGIVCHDANMPLNIAALVGMLVDEINDFFMGTEEYEKDTGPIKKAIGNEILRIASVDNHPLSRSLIKEVDALAISSLSKARVLEHVINRLEKVREEWSSDNPAYWLGKGE